MQLIAKYSYQPLERNTILGGLRHYICPQTGRRLPSVTSVLDQTADKSGLLEWRKRVGEKKADEIKNEALGLGNLMHTHLERYIAGQPRPGGNNLVRMQAEAMADQIIDLGLKDVSEVWGSEVGLYYPGLYAGTADLTCVYNGTPCIFDLKTARRMKKREQIEDYFLQLCAYGVCHNELYDTDIRTGVVLMVDRDFQFEKFVLEGDEFQTMTVAWFDRLEQFLTRSSPSICITQQQ